MRIIDADALIKKFCGTTCGCNRNECGYELAEDGIDGCWAVKAIEDAPTIDATPVRRRGEWVFVIESVRPYKTEIEERCSLCGRYVRRYGTQPQDNFCPNCGADMRGETE